AGHVDPEIAAGRRNARIWGIAENQAAHRGHFSGEAWVAVSGAAPHGGRGLDFRVLGRLGKQSAREILPANESRAEAVGSGNRKVGTNFLGYRAGSGSLEAVSQ